MTEQHLTKNVTKKKIPFYFRAILRFLRHGALDLHLFDLSVASHVTVAIVNLCIKC